MADSPRMEVQAASSAGQASSDAGAALSAAVQAAVDEIVEPGGAKAAAAPAPAVPAPVVVDESEKLRELQAFGEAQQRWGRDRERLTQEAKGAKDLAKREIMVALQSDDPDGQLEQLGLSRDQRRAIVERMVLRHVDPEKADPAVRARIEQDQRDRRLRELEARVAKQDEEREQERHQTTRQAQAQAALSTLHDAFRSVEGGELAKARFAKRPQAAVADALELAKELIEKGEINTKMSNEDISRTLVKKLNERYADEFGIGIAAPPAPERATSPTTKAAEVSAARTITRVATEVTRPPAPASRRTEDEELADMAADLAKLRREGKLSS